jgi:molecular chaperone Hsp31 and glyoxalase 3
MSQNDNRAPTPDTAEPSAFFPSPFSLSQFVAPTTGAQPVTYPPLPAGARRKVLVVGTDQRYMLMGNGRKFSTGNHPVETFLPIYHLDQAGYDIEVATVSGDSVKIEMWAMPSEDELVLQTYRRHQDKFEHPKTLRDVVAHELGEHSPYAAVFLPGGHGAMLGLPESLELQAVLRWAQAQERLVIALCHGPAALLAGAADGDANSFPFKGHDICAFPDAVDRQTPEIGYIPGPMPWYMGEKLTALGVRILNDDITGRCHLDRNLLTGDSPLASDAIGRLAVQTLRECLTA